MPLTTDVVPDGEVGIEGYQADHSWDLYKLLLKV